MHSLLAVFLSEHVRRVSLLMCAAAFCIFFSASAWPAHSLFLKSSPEMKDRQPYRGQTCPSRTRWKMQSYSGQNVHLQGCPLLLAVGPHQEMEPTHSSTTGLLGKSGEFVHQRCVVKARRQASPPKGRNLPMRGGEA